MFESLRLGRQELTLRFTLPTGQSFRWRQTAPDTFTGVVGQRVLQLRQLEDDVAYRVIARGEGADASGDLPLLRDYLNLHVSLPPLAAEWASRDPRFRHVAPHFPGARMLRQDPVECLFQFVCSSNNNISRIHGMVEKLCSRYGQRLHLDAAGASPQTAAAAAAAAAGGGEDAFGTGGLSFFAFPTLEQLALATEEDLRADGFG